MKVLRKLWSLLSYAVLLYGYYLVFLFFLDTFYRLFGSFWLASLLSLLCVGLIFSLTLLFWFKDKILQRLRDV